MNIHRLMVHLGVQVDQTSLSEKLIAGAGAFTGIIAVYVLQQWFLPATIHTLLLASVGATAVLIFAAPHGPMSQPWPILGSYLICALIGVLCFQWLGNTAIATALAVGMSVTAMYGLRCLHPPGGAVAFIAVAGGEHIHALGYGFVALACLTSAVPMVIAGFSFNYNMPWRRYPHSLAEPPSAILSSLEYSDESLEYALEKIDSFIDISPQDLRQLIQYTQEHKTITQPVHPKPT